MTSWTVAEVWIGFVAIYVAYQVGYQHGYKAGLAYGLVKLKEFHEYVRSHMRSEP
jgi:hypothetical protein